MEAQKVSGCTLCPRECGVDRSANKGACGCGSVPYIARAALHLWEEPFISGSRGSGAIFFCGCNMRCVFCQNFDISRAETGERVDAHRLAQIMLLLQEQGAHNINLVTPAPHTDILIPAITIARAQGLNIPTVYNTNAYEKAETLRRLDGLIDIYLPDLKYVSSIPAGRYSGTPDYFEYAATAVLEMQRQVGALELDGEGMARRGIVIRHLVLPCSLDETRGVLDFIRASLPIETYISLMCQYVPMHGAKPPIDRKLLPREYDRAVEYCASLGFENVLLQEQNSADTAFIPAFDGETPHKQ